MESWRGIKERMRKCDSHRRQESVWYCGKHCQLESWVTKPGLCRCRCSRLRMNSFYGKENEDGGKEPIEHT